MKSSRRLLVVATALVTLGGARHAFADAPLTGAFVWPGTTTVDPVPPAKIPAFLDEVRAAGNDTIILSHTRIFPGTGCATTAADFQWVVGFPGRLATWLDAAAARNMTVLVGTTSSNQCSAPWSSTHATPVVDDAVAYGAYASLFDHPAFAGWYVPDEPGVPTATQYDFYGRLAARLHALTPSKRVGVSPYKGETSITPTALADRALAFRDATHIDLQIWQDGIGASTSPKLSIWSRPGYSTEDYYNALVAALGASNVWADLELFNYGDPLFPQRSGFTGRWRSASVNRINQQAWAARATGKRVSFLHQWQMSAVTGPENGFVEAPALLGMYRAMYGISGRLAVPLNHANYVYSLPANPSYPDTNHVELFDRRTGDPRNPTDPAWIGFETSGGALDITIDLGATTRVNWVDVHVLAKPAWGIRTPGTMTIRCGDGTSFWVVDTASSPFSPSTVPSGEAEEYVLGNRTPLGASCRQLQLHLISASQWLFLSEVEIAAAS